MSKNPPTPQQAPSSIPIPKSRRGFRTFWAEVGRELKKVNWPSRAETNRLTGTVLAICLLLITVLAGMHFVFHQVIEILTRGF